MSESAVRPLALVTGASSGIGLELAKQFAEHGFDLIVAAEDVELDDAVEELRTFGVAVAPVSVELNCASTVHLAKRVAQDMAARGEGRILFTSSVVSQAPAPFHAVHGASKAFVHMLALALREELSDRGVSVTALLPGPTDTEFFDRAGMQDARVGASGAEDDPAQVARQGFEALMAGGAQVLGGSLTSRVMGAMSRVMPDVLAAKANRTLSEPGTA